MNEQNIPQSSEPIQSSKHVWITIIAVVITAIIVGGGGYAWQNSSLRSVKQSLQQQIADLQNQIINLQKPTQPVATTPEKIQEPTQPDDETASWLTYENKKIGFSFRYPASYGDFQISINNGEAGKEFKGNFQNKKYFSIGGITEDYTAGRDGSFLDFVKYLYEDGKYYYLMALDRKRRVEPIKIMSVDNQEVLIINGNSYVEERNIEGPTINPSLFSGALINIPGTDEFQGMAVGNYDVNTLPQSNFEEILTTFKFTK